MKRQRLELTALALLALLTGICQQSEGCPVLEPGGPNESDKQIGIENRLQPKPVKENVLEVSQARHLFRNLQDEESVRWWSPPGGNNNYFETQNLDLFDRAKTNLAIARLHEWADPESDAACSMAIDAFLSSDTIGDTAASAQALKLIMKSRGCQADVPEFTRRLQAKLISHLVMTGRTKEAAVLCRRWIETTQGLLLSDIGNRHQNKLTLSKELEVLAQVELRRGAFVEVSTSTDSETFALFNRTRAAIQNNNVSTSQIGIKRLIEIYQNEPAVYDFRRKPLNLFCILEGLSRDLVDHKRFDEANSILNTLSIAAVEKELTPIVAEYLNVELAINQELQRKSSSPWTVVDDQNSLVQDPSAFRTYPQPDLNSDQIRVLRTQENMRRFAALYSAAGYLSRADILINRGLGICKQNAPIMSNNGSLNIAESKIMLLLDAAVIRAKQGRCAESEKLALDAIGLCSSENLTDHIHSAIEFRGGSYKIIQVVQALCDSKHEEQALRILQAIIPKLNQTTEVASLSDPGERTVSYATLRRNSIIYAYTAKLLFRAGRITEAQENIAIAVGQAANNIPFPYSILGADIAKKASDYATCAHYYSEAAKSYQGYAGISNRSTDYVESLLRQAITYGEKTPKLDRLELASIYVRLATELQHGNPLYKSKEVLNLYIKTRALIPDTEPRKVDLLSKIASMQQIVANEARLAGNTAEQPSSEAADKEESPAEKQQREIADAKSQIELSLQAAQLAEKLNRTDAAALWIRLAAIVSTARMPDKAIEYARHGISLLQMKSDTVVAWRELIPSNYGLITSLQEQNRSAEAESLLRDANEGVATVCGANSPAAAIQLSQYFSYLVREHRDYEALKVLDQIIAVGMRHIEIGGFITALSNVTRTTIALPKEGRSALALESLNKILAAQRKTFDADDMRISNTLADIAKINTAQDQSVEAEKNVQEASAIKKLYLGEQRAIAETTSQIAEMKAEYEEACSQAPYSPRCVSVLERLLEFGESHKDWELVANAASKRIEIYKRTPDCYAGRAPGCVRPRFSRMDFYKLAIESNLRLGKKGEASRLLNRAAIELPEPALLEMLELAKLEEACGDHELAVKYAKEVESSLNDDEIWIYGRLAGVWALLGDKERAAHLRAAADRAWSDYQRKTEEKQRNPLSQLQ